MVCICCVTVQQSSSKSRRGSRGWAGVFVAGGREGLLAVVAGTELINGCGRRPKQPKGREAGLRRENLMQRQNETHAKRVGACPVFTRLPRGPGALGHAEDLGYDQPSFQISGLTDKCSHLSALPFRQVKACCLERGAA